MRVLIISCVYPPEPVTSAATSADLAYELVKRGHEVTVITSFPNRPAGRLMNGYSRKPVHRENMDGCNVIRTWHTFSHSSGIASRMCENISFGLSSTLQFLLRKEWPDVVYMNTWPVFAQNMNSFFLARRNIPIVCSVQDIYPESLMQRGRLAPDGCLGRTMRHLDRAHLQRCHTVCTISEPMADLLGKDREIPEDRLHVVLNWMDEEDFSADLPRDCEFRKRCGVGSDVFLALFAGSLVMAAGVDVYVKAARLLKGRDNITIALVGDGSRRVALEKIIAEENLANIKVIHPLLRADVPAVQAAADVLLMNLTGGLAGSAAPSKLVAYMLSGRPVIAGISAESMTADTLTKADAGFVIPPDDAEALATLLRDLADSRADLTRLGENARRYAIAHFSKRAVLPKLADLVEKAAR